MTKEQAYKLRAILEKAAQGLEDKEASEAPSFFPRLKENGELVKAGTKINWKGGVKRAAVDLWDRAENNPDHAPALWEDIEYKDGIRIIPDTLTAGTAFALDELGWRKGEIYKSLLANNIWPPDVYPSGWEVVAK